MLEIEFDQETESNIIIRGETKDELSDALEVVQTASAEIQSPTSAHRFWADQVRDPESAFDELLDMTDQYLEESLSIDTTEDEES